MHRSVTARGAAGSAGRLLLALVTSTAVLLPARARGQSPADPTEIAQPPRSVSGRVLRPSGAELAPVGGVWVTLHRVGPDSAGPLDSARTTAGGRYDFRYQPWGSEDAVYFVSAFYADIAYFSGPLTAPRVSGDEAEIVVYDTTSQEIPLTVRGRHVVVGAAEDGGTRGVIEIYEVSNDSSITVVAGSDDRPVWTARLPDGARGFAARQGDVPDDAMTAADGRVRVFAPFAPGIKQIAFSYQLPESAFPLALPLERPVPVLEVLIEEPTGEATGARLAPVDPVSVEGRTFRRFLADEAPANAVVRISVPESVGEGRGLYFAIVATAIGAAMLFALARSFGRPRRARVRAGDEDPERLAREIADLDARFERMRAPTDEQRAQYRMAREALKGRLGVALDRQRDPR